MANETILSKELLHNLFIYCEGFLYWKKRNGKKAGSAGKRYLQTAVNKKLYGNHRLIFMMFHGFMPERVDHIDGNTFNNCIENLRKATHAQNCLNAKLRIDRKTGAKGVTKSGNKYRAVLSLGTFDSIELAQKAVIEARNKYHGVFANHG